MLLAILAGLVGTISQARRAELESQRARDEAGAARAERDRVLEAQRIQRGTNEFLQLLMRDAATGEPGALRRQLDRTTELLDKTEFETPVVKISLLRQTAARYGEIAAWREGLSLMRRAQTLAQGPELAGPTSAVPVNLACSTARYAYEMGDLSGALRELDDADRRLAQGAQVGVPSRVECQLYRGYVELAQGRFDQALTTTLAAMQALEASGIRTGEQHRIMRSAVARALASVGRTSDALAIAEPLLAESEAGQGRQSMAVILWAIDKDHSSDIGRLLVLRARIHAVLGHHAGRDADKRAAAELLEVALGATHSGTQEVAARGEAAVKRK